MPIIAKKNYDSNDVLFRVLESNENDEVRDFVRFLRNDKNGRLVRNFKEVFIKKMEESYQEILVNAGIKNYTEQKEKYNQKEAQNIIESIREVKANNEKEKSVKMDAELEALKQESRGESNSVRVSDEVERFKNFIKKPLRADSADFKDCVFATIKGLDESAFKTFLITSLKKESLADLTAMAKNLREKTIHATSFIDAQKEVLISGIVDLAEQQKELSKLAEEVKILKEKSAELTQQVENKEAPEILVEVLEDEYVDDDKYQKYLDSLPKEERERLERESLEIAIAEEEREDYEREYENKIYQQISSKLDSAERMHENLQKDLAELNNQSKEQRNEARETEVDKDDNTRRM